MTSASGARADRIPSRRRRIWGNHRLMRRRSRLIWILAFLGCVSTSAPPAPAPAGGAGLEMSTFAVDVTPPLEAPVFSTPTVAVDTPLELRGVVLSDGRTRYVLAALDFQSTSKSVYDLLRRKLGEAAGIPPYQVLIHCTHTHSAPWGREGNAGNDQVFQRVVERGAAAVTAALGKMRPLTGIGVGKAKVEKFASNRQVPGPDGKFLTRWSS